MKCVAAMTLQHLRETKPAGFSYAACARKVVSAFIIKTSNWRPTLKQLTQIVETKKIEG